MNNGDIGEEIDYDWDLDSLDLFNEIPVNGLQGVRVFDIGQGDCIGILDEDDNVVLYVDYGGVISHPDQADYDNVSNRLDVNHAEGLTPIIITHWDKDHYYSATKNSDAVHCQWIVPRQKASPSAVTFAATLTNAACWPESIGDTPRRFPAGPEFEVEIRKNQPYDDSAHSENRNLTGLAVAVVKLDAVGDDEEMILLPGDCSFDRIANLPDVPIKGLLAYHHGSHTHWDANDTYDVIDDFTTTRRIVFSYGSANPYGHPDRPLYDPDWLPHAVETPDVRSNGDEFEDIHF